MTYKTAITKIPLQSENLHNPQIDPKKLYNSIILGQSAGELHSVLESFEALLGRALERFGEFPCIVRESLTLFWKVSGQRWGQLPSVLESLGA